jgi:hypothetical protein
MHFRGPQGPGDRPEARVTEAQRAAKPVRRASWPVGMGSRPRNFMKARVRLVAQAGKACATEELAG